MIKKYKQLSEKNKVRVFVTDKVVVCKTYYMVRVRDKKVSTVYFMLRVTSGVVLLRGEYLSVSAAARAIYVFFVLRCPLVTTLWTFVWYKMKHARKVESKKRRVKLLSSSMFLYSLVLPFSGA